MVMFLKFGSTIINIEEISYIQPSRSRYREDGDIEIVLKNGDIIYKTLERNKGLSNITERLRYFEDLSDLIRR